MLSLMLSTKVEIPPEKLLEAQNRVQFESGGKIVAYFEKAKDRQENGTHFYYLCLAYPMENRIWSRVIQSMYKKAFAQKDKTAKIKKLKKVPRQIAEKFEFTTLT